MSIAANLARGFVVAGLVWAAAAAQAPAQNAPAEALRSLRGAAQGWGNRFPGVHAFLWASVQNKLRLSLGMGREKHRQVGLHAKTKIAGQMA